MNQWLRVPPVGLLESPVLSPSILEVDLVNTKAPDPARPASWDFVNTNYLLQLPTPVEFAATVDGHAAGAQQGYFQLRVVLAEQVKIVPSFSPRSKTLTLTWNTVPGNFYRVMSKANLGDTNWTDLSGLLTAQRSSIPRPTLWPPARPSGFTPCASRR